MHLEENPGHIVEEIQSIVLNQQNEFNRIWQDILKEMQGRIFFG
jgi:polyphosphate kinase